MPDPAANAGGREADPGLSATYWAERFADRLAQLADVNRSAVSEAGIDEFLRRRAEFTTPEDAAAQADAEGTWIEAGWYD